MEEAPPERWYAGVPGSRYARVPFATRAHPRSGGTTVTPVTIVRHPDSAGAAGTATDDPRSRLLDGLAESIADNGYRNTTVAEIVRRARTSRRTFYEHFSDQ